MQPQTSCANAGHSRNSYVLVSTVLVRAQTAPFLASDEATDHLLTIQATKRLQYGNKCVLDTAYGSVMLQLSHSTAFLQALITRLHREALKDKKAAFMSFETPQLTALIHLCATRCTHSFSLRSVQQLIDVIGGVKTATQSV